MSTQSYTTSINMITKAWKNPGIQNENFSERAPSAIKSLTEAEQRPHHIAAGTQLSACGACK